MYIYTYNIYIYMYWFILRSPKAVCFQQGCKNILITLLGDPTHWYPLQKVPLVASGRRCVVLFFMARTWSGFGEGFEVP